MADRSGQTTHEFTTKRILKIFLSIWLFGGVCGLIVGYNLNNILQQLYTFITVNWWSLPTFIGSIATVAFLEHKYRKQSKVKAPVA